MPASHSATQAHQPAPQVPTKYKECFLDKNPKLRDAPAATFHTQKKERCKLSHISLWPFPDPKVANLRSNSYVYLR